MSLPSNLNDETNCHTCILVCSTECIYYEKLLVTELFLSKILNCCPNILFHWMVVVWILRCIPPYCVLRILVHNDIFIFRRTSSVDTCLNVNCTKLCLLTNLVTLKAGFCLFLE